nr:5-methylthioadenosine/S-adenosylhomocysteine deaminase [Candidatus Cloacimonadota bacterium]
MKYTDTIIYGGMIVTMDPDFRILEDHFIAIDSGKILDILPRQQLKNFSAKKQIDASGCLVTPGFVNAHTHVPMSYFRGLADDIPLDRWLNDYIWPLEAKMISGDYVYDSSLHAAAEMIKNGITLCNDMYFHADRIAEAFTKAGIRIIISQAIIGHNFKKDPSEIAPLVDRMKGLYQDNPLVDCAIAPHAIYTCSKEILKACADAAKANDWMIHTHLSENQKELEDCLKEHSKRPLEYLESLGFLEAKCLFAHGVWLSGSEQKKLANAHAAIAMCVHSNLKLGNGIAPLKDMLQNSVKLAIGTDGVASNNSLDILGELGTLARLHKGINHDPTILSAKQAFSLLTIDGAKALGKGKDLGSIEIEKQADIAIIDIDNLATIPLYNPYSHLIYAVKSEMIRDLMVAGKLVMENRTLINLDEAEILNTAKSYKDKILQEIHR